MATEVARIASLAEGGEIIASHDTVTSSARSIPVVDAREVQLKGISDPVEIVTIDSRQVSTDGGGDHATRSEDA